MARGTRRMKIHSALQVAVLMEDARAGRELTVDLPTQTVTRTTGDTYSFEVTAFRPHRKGLRVQQGRAERCVHLQSMQFRVAGPLDCGHCNGRQEPPQARTIC